MNKRPNPFMPNPYPPPQPPLPAGPPPPGPQQTQQYDYSAYWAAAAAAQQGQTGTQATPQWAPPTVGAQPPQPPRTQEQSALYANYGYGGAAGQQQALLAAQQQQQQQRPAAPYWTPPAPGYPTAAAPYPYPQQPPAAYQPQPPPAIPYTPQAPPMPMYQHQHQHQHQPPHPHPPQVAPPPPPPQPQRRFQPPQQPQQQQQQPHHLPAPPAKRPRFDSGPPNPNNNNNNNSNWRNNNSNNTNNNSNGIPTGPAQQHGNFPPQQPGFERFTHGSRGGRGGGVMVSANSNRGRGFNRGNFRHGHGHGNNPPRGPSGYRNPGPSGAPYGPRHGLPANPTKREREAKRERERDREGSYAESEGTGVERHGGKRTLTDFRIVGVECGAIGWEWGVLGRVKEEKDKDDKADEEDKSKAVEETKVKDEPVASAKLPAKSPQPAPSRLRIYFHSASDPEADALPRKRKKDADEEDEEGGVRKKVQGGEDARVESKEVEKSAEKDDHEETAPEVQKENDLEEKLEDLGDDQDADGEEDTDHIPKPEQDAQDLHFPERIGSPEQDAVSQKPPPTPTPRESTPVDPPQLESTPAPPVEGQVPMENGSAEPHVEGATTSNDEPSAIVDPAPPTTEETAEPRDSTASSVVQENVVSSEAGDVSLIDDSLADAHGIDHESEAHDAADMSASTIDEPIAFPSLDSPAASKSHPLPQAPDRSANRISISYANSTRRLVIDADVVKKVRIVRAKARVEITLSVEVVRGDKAEETKDVKQNEEEKEPETETKDEKLVLGEHDRFRGVLVEVYNESTQRYELITPYAATQGDDLTIPDLSKTGHTPSEITIVVHLDRDKPLTETKWVKTGDLDEWLSNEFGPLRPDPSGQANWSGKIQVADPDPAPTITTLMDAWCGHTMVGQPKERRRFVRQHMSNIDHVLEILLRLVRGERATAGGGQHERGQQQTHVSLAVLAIFRVATDYGARAGIEREVIEERVSEIVRSLPTHLVYKSLDGMFREWSFTQKKGEKGARDKS
ncbi:unnamed protein product [Rhizoctonia solani]|uniref:Uncharacterized protein n=1 Tax=Rhizoctonia solani TaxID=456999 RepID=A0A8H3BIX3_9AGAM|nr:unnamed protein product [Rhizoctonia solani]